jgi:hypothetical protein
MRTEQFLDEIVRCAQIPSESRRREVLRELRAHVEDFVVCARSEGHTEEEAERLARASFGDPRQIAMQFGWVYRKQRAALRVSAFVLSIAVVAAAIAGIVMSLQAGLAIGLGVPLAHMLSARHTMIEAADILASATAYLGLLALEKRFDGQRLLRAAGALAIIFAMPIGLFRVTGGPWMFLAVGLTVGLFLRTVQTLLKSAAVRCGVVLSCFGLFGMLSFGPIAMASWVVMGAGYFTMTHLAAEVDRAVFRRLQYL